MVINLFSESICDLEHEGFVREWDRMKLKKKIEFGAKVLSGAKLNLSKIQELESKPDFLTEDEMEKIESELKVKIVAAKRISDEIATLEKKIPTAAESEIIILLVKILIMFSS
jgi:hypothetical protein